MLLKSTEAWNFGIHEHIKIEYQNGFVVVTGKNKQGKSTAVIQATLYGLFGTGMLEANLADTVRQGEKETSLKVRVEIGDYVVTRSKSSAMVTGEGVKISGQAKVSDFIREQLGLKPGSEDKIMAAEQNMVTGVLSGKPGEVNKFIESVAGFSKVDEIIKKVEEAFPYGSKNVYQEFLEEARGRLAEARAVEFEDLEPYKARINELGEFITETTKQKRKLISDLGLLMEEMDRVKDEERRVKSLKEQILWKEKLIRDLGKEVEDLARQLADVPVFSEDEVKTARKFISEWPTMVRRREAHLWVTGLEEPEAVWEGDVSSLLEEISLRRKAKKSIENKVAGISADIRALRKQVVSGESMVCRTCGTDLSDRYEKINKELQNQIRKKEKELSEVESKLTEFEDIEILEQIKRENDAIQAGLDRFQDIGFVIERSVVPHKIQYADDPTVKGRWSEENYRVNLELVQEYDASVELVKSLTSRIETKNKKKSIAESELKELQEALSNRPELPEYKHLADQAQALRGNSETLRVKIKEAEEQRREAERVIQRIQDAIKVNNTVIQGEKKRIEELKESIRKDERNWKLVANVRAAKVKVLNQVWSNILVYVSSQYSSIMGDQVEVVRTETGFLVNGKPFKRLSGSERTVLGVSLRAALRAIFAERCECMLWDEPLDGADRETAAAIIAAIKSIPGQNIMITHDNDSVEVCDQRIIIGENG